MRMSMVTIRLTHSLPVQIDIMSSRPSTVAPHALPYVSSDGMLFIASPP